MENLLSQNKGPFAKYLEEHRIIDQFTMLDTPQ